jgi:prephenate dehydrogenase
MTAGGFRTEHLAIVGLGLMGGSLALALRESAKIITGIDLDPATRDFAIQNKIIDHATSDLKAGVKDADTVLLCAPVRTIIQLVDMQIGAYLRSNTLLIDIGSTKQDICDVMGRLPIGVQAMGGHPMTGKESSGVYVADANLYRGRPFVLCPTRRTTPATRLRALELVSELGAIPIEMEAKRHDKVVAVISHLPYLLSAALVATVAKQGERDDAVWKLAAGGFRDTSRLAASDVQMYRDILGTNTEAVATILAHFRMQLAILEAALISHDDLELDSSLTSIREKRVEWTEKYQNGK